MALEIYVTIPTYKTEAEVYAAKPWLQAGSVHREGGYWVGTDGTDGQIGAVGRVDQQILLAEAQGVTQSTGLVNFGLAKSGSNYDGDGAGNSPAQASLFGGGLFPLPGLGALGSGKYGWLLWGLIALGAVLILSGPGGKASRGA
jgi:hypothetical protein